MTEIIKRAGIVCLTAADVDAAVHHTDTDPTEAQKEAGNYRKAAVVIDGVQISIENPRGSKRSGVGKDGVRWECEMPDHYGYIKGTVGADDDHLDITIGPDHTSTDVYVIDQVDPKTGQFDEHKCFMWFGRSMLATSSYWSSFSDGSGPSRMGKSTKMAWDEFKSWVQSGDLKNPAAKSKETDFFEKVFMIISGNDTMRLDDPICISMAAVIKSRVDNGERIVEVEASTEAPDSEGDVIIQKALLDSAESFIKSGHLDIDHISELGARMGISNPLSWIVGAPLEVIGAIGGSTSVKGEIARSKDGEFDPKRNKFDAFWDSLQQSPAVKWRASIYGYPIDGMVQDCRSSVCTDGATRYSVKGIDWRSLAFTRNPVNTSLTGFARIVTAKSFAAGLAKDYMNVGMGSDGVPMSPGPEIGPMAESMGGMGGMGPFSMAHLVGDYHTHIKADCAFAAKYKSTDTFKDHFALCRGMPMEKAEICAHALMNWLRRESRRKG